MTHLLIVTSKDGVRYIGPFPTFFRANEYGWRCSELAGYLRHEVVELIVPHTMRVKFK